MGVREACARSHLPPCRSFGACIETDFVVESTQWAVVLSTFLYLLESGPAPAQNMPEEDEVDLWGKLDSASQHESCEETTRRILQAVGRGQRADDVPRVNLQVAACSS